MKPKPVLIVIALAALAAAMLWLWDVAPSDDTLQRTDRSDSPVVVESTAIFRQTVTDIADYTGSLQPGSQFVLAPKVGGRLRSLLVDIGDTVQQDQIIARLDNEEFVQNVAEQRAALEVAEAQLADAHAQLEVRKRSFERVADLHKRGLTSAAEHDVARSEFDAASAGVRVAQAQLAQRQAALLGAEVRLGYTTVQAEWNGSDSATVRRVGERFVDEGTNLAANEPIISVIDASFLRAVIFVTGRDFARLAIGQRASIRSDAWPGESFEGQVQRIAPLLREDTRQARVEIRVPNPEGRLSPGFFVQVAVEIEQVNEARVVPLDALTRHGGRQGVFVVAKNGDGEPVARWVPVTVGVRTEQVAQILAPDIDGEVITLGQHRLSDGRRIRVSAIPAAQG